jgi:hypothetical protein
MIKNIFDHFSSILIKSASLYPVQITNDSWYTSFQRTGCGCYIRENYLWPRSIYSFGFQTTSSPRRVPLVLGGGVEVIVVGKGLIISVQADRPVSEIVGYIVDKMKIVPDYTLSGEVLMVPVDFTAAP